MLGKGGFAHVYRAYNKETGKEVGIKMVSIYLPIVWAFAFSWLHTDRIAFFAINWHMIFVEWTEIHQCHTKLSRLSYQLLMQTRQVLASLYESALTRRCLNSSRIITHHRGMKSRLKAMIKC